jgi:protein TonB
MLATQDSHVDVPAPARTACVTRLRLVANASIRQRHADAVWNPRSGRRLATVALTLALHALLIASIWYARPWTPSVKPPARVEVALIAPPEPEKPKPPPPPRPPDRPSPKRTPLLVTVPLVVPEMPRPLTTPIPAVAPQFESPVRAIEAPVVSDAPIGAAPVVAPPPPELVPPRFDAAYLDNPAPIYPAAAKRAAEEGRVLLRVLVSADGHAQSVEIARTSGSDRLDQSALEAVRKWRFVPARRGDANVAAYVNVPIVFSLRR